MVNRTKISQEVKSTAQFRKPKQTKCVTAIIGMEVLLGTASTPPAALGRTRSRRSHEGPADLDKLKQVQLMLTRCTPV